MVKGCMPDWFNNFYSGRQSAGIGLNDMRDVNNQSIKCFRSLSFILSTFHTAEQCFTEYEADTVHV
jgi:hypothetical protein